MSDQSNATGNQGAGQLSQDIDNVGSPVQPKYITLDEAKALADQAAEQAFRRAQGLVTKRDQAVQESIKSLKEVLEMQRKSGIAITAEQEETLQNQAILQAFKKAPQPDQPETEFSPEAEEGEVDPVTAIAINLETRYGVTITDQDPEARGIKADGTPDEYIETYLQAIQAKAARLQKQPVTHTPTNLGAAGAPTTPIRDFKEARNYLSRGLRGGNQ